MKYVALLRGINVGGNSTISMARLKVAFEECGFEGVRTYINSGNVIFSSAMKDEEKIVKIIEKCIQDTFSLTVPVVIRSKQQIDETVKLIPEEWVTNADMRTDVMFLWAENDRESVLDEIATNQEVDHVIYVPGAVVWNFDRAHYKQSKLPNIIGTKVYKLMTGRNTNTVRKLHQLMNEA